MNTRKVKKIKLIICIILLLNLISLIISADVNKKYEVYVDDRLVGYVENKNKFKDTYNEFKEKLENRVGLKDITSKKIKFKSVNSDNSISSKDQIENNIKKTINTEVDGKIIKINNTKCGSVVNELEANEVLQSLVKENIKESDVDISNVLEVNLNANMECVDAKMPISDINTISEVVENINNNKNIKDNIKVQIKVKEDKIVKIESQNKIQDDESMYIGENKVVEGEEGSKHVISEVTYCNSDKIKEDIISEDIIKEEKDRIEYRGSKISIGNNIAFLKAPTRGKVITSKFGARWGKNHNGIDIAGNTGDPVTAAYDGTVEEAATVEGYGNMIQIKHEEKLETIYGHLSVIKVSKGQKVKKGDIIGEVGSTGRSTGPHLHFELRCKGSPINPEGYILSN